MVLVFEWKHSTSGFDTGQVTREYRCQSCGHKLTMHPKMNAWAFIIVGAITACAVFPLGFVWLGWYRLTQDKRYPVVADAPMPPLKFKGGPPTRNCTTCGNEVLLLKVTRQTHRGVPTGTEFEYSCTTCKKKFVIESAGGHFFSALGVLMMLGVAGAFFDEAESAGWKYGGSGTALLIALFLVVQSVARVRNRFQYPEVDPPLS